MKTRTKIMAVLGLLVSCSVGLADELLVPSQYPTIQSAIDDTNEGDTVIVADGVSTGEGNRDIDFLGKAITVRSENGPNNCTINCENSGRGFYFHSGEDANSIVDGFTVTNGYADSYGGGIYCEESSPTITNCTFSENSSSYCGGGMYNDGGSPTITNCTFSRNSVISGSGPVFGGGICNDFGSPTITNCTFSGNLAYGDFPEACGGGMYNGFYSSPTVANCTFSGNSASAGYHGDGGGMYNNKGGRPTITNCTFSGNTISGCVAEGGGMHNLGNSPTVTNCTFSGNSASAGYHAYGGGIYNREGCNLTITNCTFSGNAVSGSVAKGGGMYNSDSNSTVANCILYGNTASEGNEIALGYTSIADVNYSDVEDGLAAVYVEPDCILNWGLGNIDADPCFVDPANGDYHLKSEGWRWHTQRRVWTWDDVTSRCIDAGNPGSPLADEPITIPDDPTNEWGQNLRINMGAYGGTAEASMPPYDWAILGDLTNDGLVNLKDYTFQAADWLNPANRQPGDLNRDSLVDISDIALLIEDWLRQTTWYE